MNKLRFLTTILLIAGVVACGDSSDGKKSTKNSGDNGAASEEVVETKEPEIIYGIVADDYDVEKFTIESGQTVGKILNQYGISSSKILRSHITKSMFSKSSFICS